MRSCATQIFTSISAVQFACLVKKVNDAGVAISGNAGSATHDGITIAWTYDPAGNSLSIQCTSAPFFMPCGTIQSKIHDLVDQSEQPPA